MSISLPLFFILLASIFNFLNETHTKPANLKIYCLKVIIIMATFMVQALMFNSDLVLPFSKEKYQMRNTPETHAEIYTVIGITAFFSPDMSLANR